MHVWVSFCMHTSRYRRKIHSISIWSIGFPTRTKRARKKTFFFHGHSWRIHYVIFNIQANASKHIQTCPLKPHKQIHWWLDITGCIQLYQRPPPNLSDTDKTHFKWNWTRIGWNSNTEIWKGCVFFFRGGGGCCPHGYYDCYNEHCRLNAEKQDFPIFSLQIMVLF